MTDKNLQNNENEGLGNETEIIRDDAAITDDSVVGDEETYVSENEEVVAVPPRNRPRKVYAGMWGVPELVAISLALLGVFSIVLAYLFLVLPTQRDLTANRANRDDLEQKLVTAKKKYGNITDTETQVAKLITSVSDFEAQFLKAESIGKASIYQRLNGLLNAYGLTNTTGPDYVPLEISENERRRGTESNSRGRSKFQSLFPGVYVTMTVEGSYGNLRRFIREVESSSEFLVISSIELEPTEDNNTDTEKSTILVTEVVNGEEIQVRKPAPPRGKTRGKIVSLRLEMAAYFQRPAEQRNVTSLPESDNLLEGVVR